MVVEPETNDIVKTQTFHLNINGNITFPDSKISKDFDIENDRFEVIKIRFVPIEKFKTKTVDDNAWGQAGLIVKIIKQGQFFESDQVIFEAYIQEFYNPGIENVTAERAQKIRAINALSLDSGMGDRTNNNRIFWSDYTNLLFTKIYLGNNEDNFYNALIRKTGPKLNSNTALDVQAIDSQTRLAWDDLTKCTVMYPFDEARYQELKDY